MTRKVDETHKEIVDAVYELVQADKRTYSEVKKREQVEELKKKFDIDYRPDVHAYAKRRKGMIDVYEVWHRESWAKAFLDILNSLIIPGIDYIHIIIVQRDKYQDSWEKTDVGIIKSRLNQILKYCARKGLNRLVAIGITEEELRNKGKLREILAKKLE